jgi:hypothetical protein
MKKSLTVMKLLNGMKMLKALVFVFDQAYYQNMCYEQFFGLLVPCASSSLSEVGSCY